MQIDPEPQLADGFDLSMHSEVIHAIEFANAKMLKIINEIMLLMLAVVSTVEYKK
jgi:hypothetical protein